MPRRNAVVTSAEKGEKKAFKDLNRARRAKDKERCGQLKASHLLPDSTFQLVCERARQQQLNTCDQFDPEEELQHYPLASDTALLCRVDDQYKALLKWHPYELVSLDEVQHLEWKPAGPDDIGLQYVDREKNAKINGENEETIRRIEERFTRKLFMCAFCLQSSTWPSKSSIEHHMIKCPKRTAAAKEPINITRQYWTKLLGAHRIYNRQSRKLSEAARKDAISARNKRCYQRRKQRQRALEEARENDEEGEEDSNDGEEDGEDESSSSSSSLNEEPSNEEEVGTNELNVLQEEVNSAESVPDSGPTSIPVSAPVSVSSDPPVPLVPPSVLPSTSASSSSSASVSASRRRKSARDKARARP